GVCSPLAWFYEETFRWGHIGQIHLIHSFDHSVVRGADIVERKSPINDVFLGSIAGGGRILR
ncbi:MAG: hypothetical protein ACPGUX_12235, partial [Halocynthiibacter sp.]